MKRLLRWFNFFFARAFARMFLMVCALVIALGFTMLVLRIVK